MPNWVQNLLLAIGIVVILSILYRILPARPLSKSRPKFSVFPKYAFDIIAADKFMQNLEQAGFKRLSATHYGRGSYMGDFLPTWVKLEVKIDFKNKTAILGSPLMVIAFDTGDLWDIATQLQKV